MLIQETVLQDAWSVQEGSIAGVKLCGMGSKNGRIYPREVLQAAMPLYEGAPSFLNHNDKHPLQRSYEEHVGIIHPAEVAEDGLRGVVELKPRHPMFESIRWDVEHKSKSIGFSHVIEGDCDKNGLVSKIEHVYSVDLVVGPATTKSIMESIASEQPDPSLAILQALLDEYKSGKVLMEQFIRELGELRGKMAVAAPKARMPEAPPGDGRPLDLKAWCSKLLQADGPHFNPGSARGWSS